MEKTSKRFEDWEEVDCNECSHYWDSSCDGASKGSRVGCNSFLATRSVVIPAKLNALEKRVERLIVSCILTNVAMLAFVLFHWLGWL